MLCLCHVCRINIEREKDRVILLVACTRNRVHFFFFFRLKSTCSYTCIGKKMDRPEVVSLRVILSATTRRKQHTDTHRLGDSFLCCENYFVSSLQLLQPSKDAQQTRDNFIIENIHFNFLAKPIIVYLFSLFYFSFDYVLFQLFG